jgi:VWFA-related protein
MFRAFGLTVLATGLLSSSQLIGVAQSPPTTPSSPSTQSAPELPRFRVGVDVVRIDAVVTDKAGRVIPNLTPDDFELRQDGKLMPVTLARFVPIATSSDPNAGSAAENLAARDAGAVEAPPPQGTSDAPSTSRPLARTDVQRSIALVVDDLSLSFESFEPTRKALHKFIDNDIQPRDLVALVRTSSPGGTLQPFTADRRVLHAEIDRLRWNVMSRAGVESDEPVNGSFLGIGLGQGSGLDTPAPRGGGAGTSFAGGLNPMDFSAVNDFRRSMSAAGSLGALNLLLRAASNLPGRRAMVFLSEGFRLMTVDNGAYQPDYLVRPALDRVIETALRNGVVIYSVDSRGLQTGRMLASDNVVGDRINAASDGARGRALVDAQEGLTYVAEQTGGFAVLNTNDIANGLGRVTDDIRSYYILGYTPAEDTFARPGKTVRLHKISVKVKRPGLTVRTRKTFLGVSDPPDVPTVLSPAQALREAADSPFATTEIPLRATTLSAYSPTDGMFVRALLHIDGSALSFTPGADGRRTADVDVLGMAFDQEGIEVGHLSTGFSLALTDNAEQAALEDGIVYLLRVPIPKPGAYHVRFAVRDRHSAALGSAGEFVQIDDIPGGAFALSGIVIGKNDAVPDVKPAEGLDTSGLLRQQARRIFQPGANLSFAYEVYNAAAPVQASATVWKAERKVFNGSVDTLTPPSDAGQRFAAAGGLKLGEKLAPGDYVLQIVARTSDPRNKGKLRSAAQQVEFEVR